MWGAKNNIMSFLTNEQKYRNYRKGRQGCYSHRWTKLDKEKVLEHNCSDRELAREIHHSVQAIQVMRCRLKKGDVKIEE